MTISAPKGYFIPFTYWDFINEMEDYYAILLFIIVLENALNIFFIAIV